MGDLGSSPGSGRSLGEGTGYPFQCSCLESSMGSSAWQGPWGHKESDMTERLICGKHWLHNGGEANKALCTHAAHSLKSNIST